MPVRGQGISHHHLHQNKTHKYRLIVRLLRSPLCTHTYTHARTQTWRNISIAFTHPHIQAAIPENTAATTLANSRLPTPCMASHSWLSEGHSLGHAQGFLHLAVNVIYSLSALRWEVHGGRSAWLPIDGWADRPYWNRLAINYATF